MDYATLLAFRSFARVLVESGTVESYDLFVASLNDAIAKADDDGKRGTVVLLEELRDGIARDGRTLNR